MAERAAITAAPRTVLGKKVKRLRRDGRLPANVYGKGIASTAIDIEAREFTRNIKATGLRSMFELTVAGESRPRYVIIRGLTRQGGTGEPLHVDFFQVDPNKPIHANVPVHLAGDSPAVRDLAGTLVQSLDIVAVRCLPLAIPDSLTVDVSGINSFDKSVTVADVQVPEDVEILTDGAIVVATVVPPRLRVAQEEGEEGEEGDEEAAAAE
jgi:large subunit ribosomal protein L25